MEVVHAGMRPKAVKSRKSPRPLRLHGAHKGHHGLKEGSSGHLREALAHAGREQAVPRPQGGNIYDQGAAALLLCIPTTLLPSKGGKRTTNGVETAHNLPLPCFAKVEAIWVKGTSYWQYGCGSRGARSRGRALVLLMVW
jgi:hypothetical protein